MENGVYNVIYISPITKKRWRTVISDNEVICPDKESRDMFIKLKGDEKPRLIGGMKTLVDLKRLAKTKNIPLEYNYYSFNHE
jgi:hypothetical protein